MNNKKFIGKHLLVGLTYLNEDETVSQIIQLHGVIIEIKDNTIFFERADNGETFTIPFDSKSIKRSQPGAVYKLKSTGESVEDVDFLCSFTIHNPQ